MFKRLERTSIFFVLLISSTICSAEMLEQWPGFYGIEYRHNFMSGAGQWQRLLVDNHPGLNVFIGGKFHTNVGFELGYNWTNRDTKHLKLLAGEALFGALNNSGSTQVLESNVRLKNTYFNFNFYYPLPYQGMTAVGAVGLQSSRQNLTIQSSTSSTPIDTYISDIRGKTRIIPRFNAGVEWMISKSWGMRALYHFEHMSDVRFRGATDDNEKPFDNSHVFSFGLIWSF